MVTLKWKCRHADFVGQLRPMPRWIAEAIMKDLAARCQDYDYWLEEASTSAI
jgi:hypothetical protein